MERLTRPSRRLGSRSIAVALVGLGIAAACSSDENGPTDDQPEVGGEGGESHVPTAGKGGGGNAATGGSGGTSAGTLGLAGTPTEPNGGAGAESNVGGGGAGAGAGPGPTQPLGEQCMACGSPACTEEMTSCQASSDCSKWLECLSACDGAACVHACDVEHADSARLHTGVYQCLCTACASDCSVVQACDKTTCVEADPLETVSAPPSNLAETGLFALAEGAGGAGDGSGGIGGAGPELATPLAIASNVKTFGPSYPLWADGAEKQRYIYVPGCATIDTHQMDHWDFPVGTRIWKTFKVEGKNVETRLMHRFGPGADEWLFAAYQWDEAEPTDPAKAKWVDPIVSPSGVPNANGTTHDIPSVGQCTNCHGKLSERVLGFGAIQLSHPAVGKDVAIKEISDLGWLTHPAPDGFMVPGTDAQRAALGYLHGNCGGCHNQGQSIPNDVSPLVLRLLVGQTTYASTDTVKTTVGIPVVSMRPEITGKNRIETNDPDNSAVLIRMKARNVPGPAGLQMPPLGTEVPDTDGGVKVVTDWVKP